VVPPAADTLGAASSVRAALRALSGSRFLAGVSERMLAFWLRQVRGYLRDPQVRAAVQQRLLAAVSGDTRVVVAHSLGSVIAYEVLCAHPEWTVTDFVTLGSPLGVRHIIYDRLRPSPGMWPHVDRWTNISDAADFVALQPRLRDLFGPRVADLAIDNGVSAHAVARYLSAKETGAAVGAAFAA
jgi:pimeloyl-ACP methyl ester carboxylesterase